MEAKADFQEALRRCPSNREAKEQLKKVQDILRKQAHERHINGGATPGGPNNPGSPRGSVPHVDDAEWRGIQVDADYDGPRTDANGLSAQFLSDLVQYLRDVSPSTGPDLGPVLCILH